MLRVTFELGKEAGNVCLRRDRRAPQAFSGGSHRFGWRGAGEPECAERDRDDPAAFEAAFGWGWLAGLLEDYGFDPHLVHPLQCKAIASARLKNDKVDAAILAQLLRGSAAGGVDRAAC